MNIVVFRAVALISGLLFGAGMAISGMIEPQKVIGFLDVTGDWDPSLAFVMGGALCVFMPSYFWLIKPRKQSVSGNPIQTTNKTKIDRRLLSGSALFGLGWGIAGICPGPAVASLAMGDLAIVLFFIAMLVGSVVAKMLSTKSKPQRIKLTETV